MFALVSLDELAALATVVVIDLVMAGDNAIVVGMVAAGLPVELRRRAILLGIGAAAGLRILFAATALHLLSILGLTLAGGLLLAWVAWKMWREIRERAVHAEEEAVAALASADGGVASAHGTVKTLPRALVQIVLADVSMSLDNVLGVAGAARDHLWVLALGLALSVALMAAASTYIARLLDRHHWLAYVGFAVVAFVALDMIRRGGLDLFRAVAG